MVPTILLVLTDGRGKSPDRKGILLACQETSGQFHLIDTTALGNFECSPPREMTFVHFTEADFLASGEDTLRRFLSAVSRNVHEEMLSQPSKIAKKRVFAPRLGARKPGARPARRSQRRLSVPKTPREQKAAELARREKLQEAQRNKQKLALLKKKAAQEKKEKEQKRAAAEAKEKKRKKNNVNQANSRLKNKLAAWRSEFSGASLQRKNELLAKAERLCETPPKNVKGQLIGGLTKTIGSWKRIIDMAARDGTSNTSGLFSSCFVIMLI